ncbi:MAG: formyltetrahydrofolate deformylase, partial [Victivallaceae bacterium]|nr:formyltetrahydrofolate deformylase [Victivallaceae bacterium]
MMNASEALFLVQTDDRKGVLAATTGFFAGRNFNIIQCRQYSDLIEGKYFMRIIVDFSGIGVTRQELAREFGQFAASMQMEWTLHFRDERQKVAIMVSKTSHCLYDLLMRVAEHDLECDVPLVIGNHPELERVADRFEIPFYCVPMTSDKSEQEAKVLELLTRHRIDLVVLARYMQVLSNDFIARYPGRIINIHHAFLPAFQGSNPYVRAWERGVKMIGATAHYATAELDEGPIIEQDVERINHEHTPDDLKQIGKDIERRVLYRAVRAHLERPVLVTGRRTTVFSRRFSFGG